MDLNPYKPGSPTKPQKINKHTTRTVHDQASPSQIININHNIVLQHIGVQIELLQHRSVAEAK